MNNYQQAQLENIDRQAKAGLNQAFNERHHAFVDYFLTIRDLVKTIQLNSGEGNEHSILHE